LSRRHKLAPPRPGYTRVYLVAVACTDKGQHPQAGIANLGQFADVDGTIRVLWQRRGHPDPLTGWQDPDGSRTFRFPCKRCGRRNVVLHEASVIAYMELMRATAKARPVVDLSDLPPLLRS
jgi:hypothetical protein